MKRRPLVSTLKKVEPALSRKGLIEAFSYFWFDGENVTAYDDIIVLRTPCEWEVKGGIRGRELLSFLSTSEGSEKVAVHTEAGNVIKIKTGGSPLTMTVLPMRDCPLVRQGREADDDKDIPQVVPWPDEEGVLLDVDRAFVQCVEMCCPGIGEDQGSAPFRYGITAQFSERRITLYSSDDFTVSRAIIRTRPPEELVGRTVQWCPSFCRQMVQSDRDEHIDSLMIDDSNTEARFKSGLLLRARNEDSKHTDVSKFESVVGELKDVDRVGIPREFERCLAKVLLLIQNEDDPRMTLSITHKGARPRLCFEGRSKHGDVSESIALPEKAEDFTAQIDDPSRVKRILKYVTEFGMTEHSLVLFGDDFVHLVKV